MPHPCPTYRAGGSVNCVHTSSSGTGNTQGISLLNLLHLVPEVFLPISHCPGNSNVLRFSLKLRLNLLAPWNGSSGSSCRNLTPATHDLASAVFYNLGTSLCDTITLRHWWFWKPTPRGFCCQFRCLLLPLLLPSSVSWKPSVGKHFLGWLISGRNYFRDGLSSNFLLSNTFSSLQVGAFDECGPAFGTPFLQYQWGAHGFSSMASIALRIIIKIYFLCIDLGCLLKLTHPSSPKCTFCNSLLPLTIKLKTIWGSCPLDGLKPHS